MLLSACISETAVSLRRVEAVKLAQAGFDDFFSGHACEQVEGEA